MKDDIALSVQGLSKDFRLPHERKNSIKERILSFRRQTFEKFHVLKDIDIEVKSGEFFGVVGRNGSGKSTLLKIIGGIYQPTHGQITVNGTLTPFIELGIGFNPELTGRENVFLNGAILGLTRKEIIQKYQEIVDFAELEKFMDQRIKNYSSGMQVRLAFSIAMQAHNDILLIDEVLAVGDASFQRKCFEKFRQIKKSGKTIIFVTHDMGAVQEFCDRAMMIQDSRVISVGEPRGIALRYELANARNSASDEETTQLIRPQSPAIKIADLKLLANSKQTRRFSIKDDIDAEITLDVRQPTATQINMYFLKADGTYLAGINSTNELGDEYTLSKGTHKLRCHISAGQFVKGDYRIGIGLYTPGYVPEIIDILDASYGSKDLDITFVDKSLYKDVTFYIKGEWSKRGDL